MAQITESKLAENVEKFCRIIKRHENVMVLAQIRSQFFTEVFLQELETRLNIVEENGGDQKDGLKAMRRLCHDAAVWEGGDQRLRTEYVDYYSASIFDQSFHDAVEEREIKLAEMREKKKTKKKERKGNKLALRYDHQSTSPRF